MDASAGGADASADTRTPSAPELVDPRPIELDRSALISTSGSHIAWLGGPSADGVGARLLALDIESGELHELGCGDDAPSIDVSPDGSTILCNGVGVAAPNPLLLARLLDDGVVPASPVAGAAALVGVRELEGWTGDGRFAVVARRDFRSRAVEVVDVFANALHGSIDGGPVGHEDGYAASATVAPRGLWLSYTVDGRGPDPRSALARIVDGGLHSKELEGFPGSPVFSADGDRVAYGQFVAVDEMHAFYVDLPNGEPLPMVARDVPELTSVAPHSFSVDADHALAYVGAPNQREALRRIDLLTGTTTPLASVDRGSISGPVSADGRSTIVHYIDSTSQELVLVDVFGARPPITLATLPYGPPSAPTSAFPYAVGADHFAFSFEERELTFVGLQADGTAALSVVSEPTETVFTCLPPLEGLPAAERFAVPVNDGDALLLVDLSSPVAARLPALSPEHGGVFGCPAWNAAGDAFAVVETVMDEPSPRAFVYTVRWLDPSAPEAPQLVHEAQGAVRLIVYRP